VSLAIPVTTTGDAPLPGHRITPCRGCGSTVRRPPQREFCLVCRENKCSSCRRIGGFHHPNCSRPDPSRRCRACQGPLEKRRAQLYCDACRTTRCPTCRQIGFHVGKHHIGPHRVLPERLDVVGAAELESTILSAYALAHDAAAKIVGQEEAFDCAHEAIAYVLARRPFLPSVHAAYIVRASVTTALCRLRRGARVALVEDPDDVTPGGDVFRSDVFPDSGTPLGWALAWEAVEAREQAERIRAKRVKARAMPLRVPIGELLEARR